MRSIAMARAWRSRPHDRAARAWSPACRPLEALEPRWVPSAGATTMAAAAPPAVQMISATTTDSKSVTIEYQVNQPVNAATPLQFGVYRSADGTFNASDSLVDTVTLVPPGSSAGQAPTLDQAGGSATALGTHTLTIALSGGLPPYPLKPFVTVVADPSLPSAATDPRQTASFRVYTIGVVTHGGIQDPSWTHGPPWELEIAYMMRHEGFDSVIPYNWAIQSSTPGAAIKQSPRLARIILGTANRYPANSVVDLVLIGHSEGTVVNTYALATLQKELPPQVQAGFIEDTLLDPHAANNDIVSGRQMSFNGPLAGLAESVVTNYQGEAQDPPPYFPSIVDQANVFFEHTPASAGGIYNLWGQVPVRSEGPAVHYYNLTAMGVTHSGKTGVNYWYRDFIAPTLGYQAPLVQQLQLNGQIDGAQAVPSSRRGYSGWPAQVVSTSQPEVSGTAAPGSIVRLLVGSAAKPSDIGPAGVTQADASGHWSLSTRRPLPAGSYRVVVSAFSRALRTRPGLAIVPTQPLGRLVVP
jgi:hypothetical protein